MNNGKWVQWTLGILVSVSLAVSGYHFTIAKALAENMVINDKEARERDDKVKEALVETTSNQNIINTQILVTLAKIDGKFETMQLDLNYIKEKIKEGDYK